MKISAYVALAFLLLGCVESIGKSEVHSVDLPAITVEVYGSGMIPDCHACAGWVRTDGLIRIVGWWEDGELVVDPEILGHEVMHLMRWGDSRYINPDDLYE